MAQSPGKSRIDPLEMSIEGGDTQHVERKGEEPVALLFALQQANADLLQCDLQPSELIGPPMDGSTGSPCRRRAAFCSR